MKTLQEEREAIVEEMRTMLCKACGGDGFTVEYDPRDQTGQTPMQAQCDYCHAEGRYTTLDELRTALLSHEEKVVERVRGEERERIKEWAGRNCWTEDDAITDLPEEHRWNVDYRELLDVLLKTP